MWRRDSGEFVMSKCKIRQEAQLTEPQGTQSQLLNRAEYCRRGLHSVLCLSVTDSSVCLCVISDVWFLSASISESNVSA